MQASLIADCQAIQGGPLTSVAEGGEDIRSLLLATSGLLWPSGGDTWFSQGGFSCALEAIGDDRVNLALEALPPSGVDDLPVVSATLVIEMALKGAATLAPHSFTVITQIPDTGGRPEWSQMNWASNLARGTGRRGAICVDVRGTGGEGYHGDAFFWSLVEEHLYSPDLPFEVKVGKNGGSAHIEEMEGSLLNLARVIDAVRSALATRSPGASVEIRAWRAR